MKKTLLWGGKSKARIVESMLQDSAGHVDYIFDPFLDTPAFHTSAVFGNDLGSLKRFLDYSTHFVVCIGGDHGYARTRISRFIHEQFQINPISVVSDHGYLDKTSTVGVGFQLMPAAVVHKFCMIGNYVLINTNATVDHECILGDGVHIMGGASVAGCVKIGNYSSIGTNATILPNLTIGEGVMVGAGAVVTKDVPDYQVVMGVPARFVRRNELAVDLSLLEKCLS